jgi:hypothetical protein
MNLQSPALQSLRPIGRRALTLMLPDEVFASRGKQGPFFRTPCLTPSSLESGQYFLLRFLNSVNFIVSVASLSTAARLVGNVCADRKPHPATQNSLFRNQNSLFRQLLHQQAEPIQSLSRDSQSFWSSATISS